MCEQKSAGICIWLQRLGGAKMISRAFSKLPYSGGEISDVGKEGFHDDISETENSSLSTGAYCDTQTTNARLDELF